MEIQRIVSSITGVVDSTGTAIGNPGTTSDTVLTLSGIGTANSVVFIFDNGVLLTPASVTINGTWRFGETVVLGRHVFTVRDEPEGVDSAAWVVIVEVVAVPTISSIKDAAGTEIPEDGTTYSTTVTLTGTAAVGGRVEIFDGEISQGQATANASGVWTLPLTGLTVKAYSITARGRYGSEPVSAVRRFTVATYSWTESFDAGPDGEIPVGVTREFTEMTITPIINSINRESWTVGSPYTDEHALRWRSSEAVERSLRMVLKRPANHIEFGSWGTGASAEILADGATIACYDEQGILLFNKSFVWTGGYGAWQEVTSPDKKIKSIIINVSTQIPVLAIDNFTFS